MSSRYFIAVDFSIAVCEQLMRAQRELAELLEPSAQVRWVHPENLHLTMKFLGEFDSSLIERLEMQLDALTEPLFPFQVNCTGIEVTPSLDRPLQLWANCEKEGAEVLSLLQRALERDLDLIGLTPDPRHFKPSILLGRVKGNQDPAKTREVLEPKATTRFGMSTIKDLVLFEAASPRGVPIYNVINRFALGGHDRG